MPTRKESIKSLDVKERIKEIKENENFITSVIGPRGAGKLLYLQFNEEKRT